MAAGWSQLYLCCRWRVRLCRRRQLHPQERAGVVTQLPLIAAGDCNLGDVNNEEDVQLTAVPAASLTTISTAGNYTLQCRQAGSFNYTYTIFSITAMQGYDDYQSAQPFSIRTFGSEGLLGSFIEYPGDLFISCSQMSTVILEVQNGTYETYYVNSTQYEQPPMETFAKLVLSPGITLTANEAYRWKCNTENTTLSGYGIRPNLYACQTVTSNTTLVNPPNVIDGLMIYFMRPPANFCFFIENAEGINAGSRSQLNGPGESSMYICRPEAIYRYSQSSFPSAVLVPVVQAEYGKNYTFTTDGTVLLQYKRVELPAVLSGVFSDDVTVFDQYETIVNQPPFYSSSIGFESDTGFPGTSGDYVRAVTGSVNSTVAFNVLTVNGLNALYVEPTTVGTSTGQTNSTSTGQIGDTQPTVGPASDGKMLVPASVLFSAIVAVCSLL